MRSKLFYLSLLFALIHIPIISIATNKFDASQEISLKKKIGQMLIIGFNGRTLQKNSPIIKAVQQQMVGGVILFDLNYKTQKPYRNIESPAQVKHLTQQLQDYTFLAAEHHHNQLWPLFIGVDYEGGKNFGSIRGANRLKADYGFPNTLPAEDIAALPVQQAKSYAEIMATTLQSAGINFSFSPVLDLNTNPQNPVIAKLGRSFSKNPSQVIKYAKLFSDADAKHHILCAYKHFPGHGSSTNDSHLGFVDVSTTWNSKELIPYQRLLNRRNSCSAVMTAHIINRQLEPNNLPATLSSKVLTELLRKKLHFNGVIITDDLQMKAITDHFGLKRAVIQTIQAGTDILLFGNQLVETPQNPKQIINIIYQAVKRGEISEERIDASYRRIMKLKLAYQ